MAEMDGTAAVCEMLFVDAEVAEWTAWSGRVASVVIDRLIEWTIVNTAASAPISTQRHRAQQTDHG